MREIKFRGKKKSTGEFVYGSFVSYSLDVGYIYEDVAKGIVWQVDPKTVDECINIEDKSNTEIYGSDILTYDYDKNYYIVSYNVHHARYELLNTNKKLRLDGVNLILNRDIAKKRLTKIGNAYDSPELLGGAS